MGIIKNTLTGLALLAALSGCVSTEKKVEKEPKRYEIEVETGWKNKYEWQGVELDDNGGIYGKLTGEMYLQGDANKKNEPSLRARGILDTFHSPRENDFTVTNLTLEGVYKFEIPLEVKIGGTYMGLHSLDENDALAVHLGGTYNFPKNFYGGVQLGMLGQEDNKRDDPGYFADTFVGWRTPLTDYMNFMAEGNLRFNDDALTDSHGAHNIGPLIGIDIKLPEDIHFRVGAQYRHGLDKEADNVFGVGISLFRKF